MKVVQKAMKKKKKKKKPRESMLKIQYDNPVGIAQLIIITITLLLEFY